MKKAASMTVFALLFVIIGVAIGFRAKDPLLATCASIAAKAAVHANEDIREVPNSSIRLTSPLLECAELPESVTDASLERMQGGVQKIMDTAKQQGNVSY